MASDKIQEYTLRVGSHTWIDGKTYGPGDKMTLTREQMERIGKDRFEGQTGEETKATIDNLQQEISRLKEQVAQLKGVAGQSEQIESEENSGDESDYSEILSKSVPDIASYLQTVHSVSALNDIQAEESKGGQPRVGVLKAINQRREELSQNQ